jgi:hypothetical protein
VKAQRPTTRIWKRVERKKTGLVRERGGEAGASMADDFEEVLLVTPASS